MRLIYTLLSWALSLYELALLVYVILSWVRPAANRWTELLRSIVEPVLRPIRRFLMAKLPARWQIIDWSVAVAWLLLGLLRRILSMIFFPLMW